MENTTAKDPVTSAEQIAYILEVPMDTAVLMANARQMFDALISIKDRPGSGDTCWMRSVAHTSLLHAGWKDK